MGVLDSLFRREETRGLSLTDYQQWVDLGIVSPTASGVSVSGEGALKYSAVWACVRVLAETVAQLPLVVYERLERGKRAAPDHPLYRVLHDQPNPIMTAFEWREALMGHLLLWGNAYCEIEMDNRGQVLGLWPLRPDKVVEVRRMRDELAYVYELPDGKRVLLAGERVWHLRGLSADGITGYSPIAAARQAIGLGLAAEEFGARFFGNGARPGGVLQHPGVLGEEGFRRVKESWQATHGGLSNASRVAILEEGMTYQAVGIPPEDAQFLETRKFQRGEIAAIFRVPPHMIGDLERATFSNIEQQSIEFKAFTMEPWLVRWQQAVNQRLMTAAEQRRYFAEFKPDALLRGDTVSRFQAYSIGRQNGWLSANDIRELENLNPIDGGDLYLVPMNMVPASEAGAAAEAPPATEEPDDQRRAPGGEQRVQLVNGAEVRAAQWDAAGARHRLQGVYRGLWEDAARRLVNRETNDILNTARRLLKAGEWQALRLWLREFYEGFEKIAAAGYEPVMEAYAAQVAEQAAREVGGDTPTLTAFIGAYLAEAGARHAVVNLEQIEALIAEFKEEALPELEKDFEHRRETQPGRIAMHESVRAANAVAMAAYRAMGVSKKTWVTFGENCPYCQELGGRTLALEGFFLGQGQSWQPMGASRPLVVNGNIGHAPAHEGCDCMVVAG